ncbi:MAG: putative F420-dependent oxidoreductase, family [Acidimicrobiales bacterium]|jgi:probable F420-dependent oxidoreductase|nr:putative F420-dependent oxidoreductase, family [Acidimicrobiales bacterium]
MKVDGGIPGDLARAAGAARDLEHAGYDGAWAAETNHDPFFPLLLAAEHTERLELGTGIAVAFPRSPMHLANVGWDLQAYSGGRFMLGLGSQIKAHVEKRFSATWSHPAARMRELILATRAIWDSWNDGTKLDFRGDFYRHTLMTPFFDPGPNPHGNPKVFLAAVGERMTEVAGEVGDGLLAHGFTTERYFREVTLPAIERGLEKSGRTRADFQISCPVFVITGTTEEEIAAADRGTREQVAFYASTPNYRPVLDLHGWGDLQSELNLLSKQGEWQEMGRRIDDDVLQAFAIRGEPEEIPKLMLSRYGDVMDRVSFYAPYKSDPERWAAVMDGFRSA